MNPLPFFTEQPFASAIDYDEPTWDVDLRVEFRGPSGQTRTVDAFWDGEQTWRVRFSPDAPGEWTFRTTCSDESNAGLHDQSGTVTVDAYDGDNPLYRHGALRPDPNRSYFVHADSTPFFYLGDTAWNGVLKANPDDWREYLAARREQGFTTIQAVMTQWRAFTADGEGDIAFSDGSGSTRMAIHPHFYQRLDGKVAAVSEQGLVPALVLLWALTPTDPGHYLPVDDAVRLARYLVARYAAYRPIWILGGDGRYRAVRRWRQIGRAVFDEAATDESRLPVTLHPSGENWVGDTFGNEAWFDFIAYQSGHGDGNDSLRWLVEGPVAQSNLPLPIINQEPNYEGHLAYHSRQPFGAHAVRRALYWSLLVSPMAGVTYGHHGIWPWMEQPGVPADHPNSGEAPTWREALHSEGAAGVSHLRDFFESVDWWRLRPAPQWLAEQPGEDDPARWIMISVGEDASFAVAYTPAGEDIALANAALASFTSARWFDPRTGDWQAATVGDEQGQTFSPPSEDDWVLLLER